MRTHPCLLLLPLALALALACRPDADSAAVDTGDTGLDSVPYEPHDYDVEGYWGAAPALEDRLEVFDAYWDELGAGYASFGASGVDWDQVRETYRPEMEAAESFGRFGWVFGAISEQLQDGHNYALSLEVCGWDSENRPPRLHLFDSASYSGACLTPLAEDRLLVTRVADDNPAGLAPGDVVLGYEGFGWRSILAGLAPLELPLCGYHSSSDLAQDYNWMSSLLSNWHLFDTLDVQRHGTDEVESIETLLFEGYSSDVVCTDQLPVEGVDLPYATYDESHGAADTSWGLLDGTNVGYVYVYSWTGDVTQDFGTAIAELMETDGLIIDQRYNTGGGSGAAFEGLELLFDEDVEDIMNCATRAAGSAYDELDINDWSWHSFPADPDTYYDRPIAVLTGPRAISAGDLVPYYLAYHPRVQRFGRTTDGSFGSINSLWYPDPYVDDVYMAYTYAACVDANMEYLQGAEIPPEVEVWLEPDDVAAGTDSVVQAALDWIAGENAGR